MDHFDVDILDRQGKTIRRLEAVPVDTSVAFDFRPGEVQPGYRFVLVSRGDLPADAKGIDFSLNITSATHEQPKVESETEEPAQQT